MATEPTATLVINSDSSYCSACGGGAEFYEEAHLTLMPREIGGRYEVLQDADRSGCGARFIATATDSFAPAAAVAIQEQRPDLLFMGVHGVEGRA